MIIFPSQMRNYNKHSHQLHKWIDYNSWGGTHKQEVCCSRTYLIHHPNILLYCLVQIQSHFMHQCSLKVWFNIGPNYWQNMAFTEIKKEILWNIQSRILNWNIATLCSNRIFLGIKFTLKALAFLPTTKIENV